MRQVTRLPQRDEMLRRLRQVDINEEVDTNEALELWFYPCLLQDAGSKRDYIGVIARLVIALEELAKHESPRMIEVVRGHFEDYVRVLVDDRQVLQQAIEHLAATEDL